MLPKGIKYVDQGLYNNSQNRSQDKPTVIWKSDILEKVTYWTAVMRANMSLFAKMSFFQIISNSNRLKACCNCNSILINVFIYALGNLAILLLIGRF